MTTTSWARIYPRHSGLRRRYYNPDLDPEYVARTSGVVTHRIPAPNPLIVIVPTPTPGSHDPTLPDSVAPVPTPAPTAPVPGPIVPPVLPDPTSPVAPVPTPYFILSVVGSGHTRQVLTVETSGEGTEVLSVML